MDRRLLSYLDGCILKDYEEIQEILRVEQISEAKVWEELEYLLEESRVQDSEGVGLNRWEVIL